MGINLSKNWCVYIVISLILVGITIYSISSAQTINRSYSIPSANIDLNVEDNGNLYVNETIHYHFNGTYNGVYRNIPLKNNQNLTNVHVNVSGAYYKYEVNDVKNQKHITVFLYSDSAMTQPISNKDIDVNYEYTFLHVVKFYNDIAELQYKIWGEEWGVPVGRVNAVVHVKSNEGVNYWLNPSYLTENASWQGSTFTVVSTPIPKNSWFEVRMVIPKDQFTSYSNGQVVSGNGLNDIENIQQNYTIWINFQEALYLILPVLIFLSMIYPFSIFYRSRKGKSKFNKECNGEIPEKESPAIVNAIYASKDVGNPDLNGFMATIMDLIKRRYILIDHYPEDEEDELILKINHRKTINHLKSFEKQILSFLKEFERNQTIHVNEMGKYLEKGHFQKRYSDWGKSVTKRLNHAVLRDIFTENSNIGILIYGFSALLGSLLLIATTYRNPVPNSIYSFYAGIPLLIVSIMSLATTSKTKGQWTDYGQECKSKWMAFKRYVQNSNSMQKTASHHSFDDYLIYGTALGVGDNVLKSLNKSFSTEELANSPVFAWYNSNDYQYLKTTMVSFTGIYGAIHAHTSYGNDWGGSGGFGGGGAGGAGGGSGGGGGGAF